MIFRPYWIAISVGGLLAPWIHELKSAKWAPSLELFVFYLSGIFLEKLHQIHRSMHLKNVLSFVIVSNRMYPHPR
jgi:hypothetical protein